MRKYQLTEMDVKLSDVGEAESSQARATRRPAWDRDLSAVSVALPTTWAQWWDELNALAAKHGKTPGLPWAWKKYNFERGQTPKEAYLAEYTPEF